MGIILVIVAVGFALMVAEMFLPGGVLGVIGTLALIVAVALGYAWFGPSTGTFLLAGVGTVTLVGFLVWMSVFPRTPVGRRMTLAHRLETGDRVGGPDVPAGAEGVAETPLRPSGRALIDGRRLDVISDGEFVDAGAAVVVTRREAAHFVVRKKA